MKRILATTAIVTLAAGPLLAETHATDNAMSGPEFSVGEQSLSADTLIGKRIYVPGGTDDQISMTDLTDVPDSWEDVGEIGDVYVSEDGQVESVVADIGGFLGVGEHEVSMTLDNLRFAPDTDDEGEYFVVYQGDAAALESKELVERDQMNEGGNFLSERQADAGTGGMGTGMDTDSAATESAEAGSTDTEIGNTETAGNATGADTAAPADDPQMNQDSAEVQDGTGTQNGMGSTEMANEGSTGMTDDGGMGSLSTGERDALTAEDLEGEPVLGPDGDRVGEIRELVLTDDGRIQDVIVDVGGFLGIGEKPVALKFEELRISRGDGDALNVGIDQTEEQLESMEKWAG